MTMNIFYITARVVIENSPTWLDPFRLKYDEPSEYHITLKQATYIQKEQIELLKTELEEIIRKFFPIALSFNGIFMNETPKGHVVMIHSEKHSTLMELQRELHNTLSHYGDVIRTYYKEYEESFDPHITIARKMSDEVFEEAKKEIGNTTHCEGLINTITLSISSGDTEETAKLLEKTEYSLIKE